MLVRQIDISLQIIWLQVMQLEVFQMEGQESTNESQTTTNALDHYCFDPLWMVELMEKREGSLVYGDDSSDT